MVKLGIYGTVYNSADTVRTTIEDLKKKLYNKMYDMVNRLIKFNENFVNVLENKDNLKLF